jgi:hypothetical protein
MREDEVLKSGPEQQFRPPSSAGEGEVSPEELASFLRRLGPTAAIPLPTRGLRGESPTESWTGSILRLLSDQEGLCKAILLAEILRRPEERWI